MEPNYFLVNAVIIALPFTAYYLGIFIRRFAMPGPATPKSTLACQCLLGIPVSLVVVSPFVPILSATASNVPGYLLTLGVIMEHGMVLNETVVSHLQDRLKSLSNAPLPVKSEG